MINPLIAFAIALGAFGLLLYKRVGLGVSLTVAAFLLGFLTVGFYETFRTLFGTLQDYNALTLIFATFAIMMLSQLYKETGLINVLSESLSGLIRNSKLILGILPAIIGLMPVAGGALMSAPMVEAEAKKLKLDKVKKTYVNLWFRHTIFPVYPVSQLLILTAALTGTTLFSIIYRQIPVVAGMIAIGYFIGLWKAQPSEVQTKNKNDGTKSRDNNLKSFLFSFSPILVTIFLVAALGVNVAVSAFVGVFVLAVISRLKFSSLTKILKGWSIYEITLAAFGAFFLRNITISSGVSDVIGKMLIQGNLNEALVLLFPPAVLAFLVGSPSGGIAISVPILAEIVDFTSKSASLLYMSAYLGYLGSPTHLCLVLTAEYFKCPLGKVYKYMIPSLILSAILTILVYLLI